MSIKLIDQQTNYLTVGEHASAPATPSANHVALYAKPDGYMYSKDDAGVETRMAAAPTLTYPSTFVEMWDVLVADNNRWTFTGAADSTTYPGIVFPSDDYTALTDAVGIVGFTLTSQPAFELIMYVVPITGNTDPIASFGLANAGKTEFLGLTVSSQPTFNTTVKAATTGNDHGARFVAKTPQLIRIRAAAGWASVITEFSTDAGASWTQTGVTLNASAQVFAGTMFPYLGTGPQDNDGMGFAIYYYSFKAITNP